MTTVDTLLFVETPLRQEDDIVKLTTRQVSLGGKGMIAAITLAGLGCRTSILSLVGAKEIENPTNQLRQLPSNLDGSHLLPLLDATRRTWIIVTPDQQTYTIISNARLSPTTDAALAERLQAFIDQIALLYLSCEDGHLISMTLASLERRPIPVVTNISTALLLELPEPKQETLEQIVKISTSLIMNERESRESLQILGLVHWSGLKTKKPREIVITMGERGGKASVKPFRDWIDFPADSTEPASCVVGAGDTFGAAFLKARFLDKRSLLDSCLFAAKIAGHKVRSSGVELHLAACLDGLDDISAISA